MLIAFPRCGHANIGLRDPLYRIVRQVVETVIVYVVEEIALGNSVQGSADIRRTSDQHNAEPGYGRGKGLPLSIWIFEASNVSGMLVEAVETREAAQGCLPPCQFTGSSIIIDWVAESRKITMTVKTE